MILTAWLGVALSFLDGTARAPQQPVPDRPPVLLVHGIAENETGMARMATFLRAEGANVVVRGLRVMSDFEYEFQMALMNRKLAPDLETVFLMPKEKYSAVSSRLVREIGGMGGNLSDLVPESLRERIAAKLRQG